jgi:hypothetical protein
VSTVTLLFTTIVEGLSCGVVDEDVGEPVDRSY